MKNSVLFAVIALLVFASCNNKGDAIQLKFNMPVGSRLEYTMDMNMNSRQKIMDQDANLQNGMGFTYLFEVLNDSAGVKKVSSTITNMKMDMHAMGNSMRFNSDSLSTDSTEPAGVMSKIFQAMKGASFTFKINEKGEVSDVQGLREIQQKVMTALPNAQAAQGLISEESFRQNVEQSFAAYPGKPVKPGDSWKKVSNINSQGMVIKSENTYTLESIKNDHAVVKVKSSLSSAGAPSMQNVEVGMTGTSTGTMNYSIATGMPATGAIDMMMHIKMKAQGMEIPMDMNMKLNVKSRKL